MLADLTLQFLKGHGSQQTQSMHSILECSHLNLSQHCYRLNTCSSMLYSNANISGFILDLFMLNDYVLLKCVQFGYVLVHCYTTIHTQMLCLYASLLQCLHFPLCTHWRSLFPQKPSVRRPKCAQTQYFLTTQGIGIGISPPTWQWEIK